MITAKINVSKIDKEFLFKGKNGTYLDVVIFENKDGPDKYGYTHYIVQSIPKEEREKGNRGDIIGNANLDEGPRQQGNPAPQQGSDQPPAGQGGW